MSWSWARGLGPAVARPKGPEMLRACLGAGIGLVLCVFLVRLTMGPVAGDGLDPTLLLIAPLGATAMLAFAVPSSPLAQPWSAVVGNTVSALVGVAVVMVVTEPWLALGLSVTLAMLAMMLLRAIHPPAAGVALGAVLTADSVREAGFSFAFSPVFIDTVLLLLVATVYNRATGRTYPFRRPADHAPMLPGEVGIKPRLEATDLTGILERLELDANIGPGDLERLIAAAHLQAAEHLFDGVDCGQIMARDVATVRGDMPLSQVAAEFAVHRVRTLPVTDAQGRYLGLMTETDLLRHMQTPTEAAEGGVLSRLLRVGREVALPTAADVMTTMVGTASTSTPLGVLIDLLAEGAQQAVPVLQEGRLVGLITRSVLIAALAKAHHPQTQPQGGKDV